MRPVWQYGRVALVLGVLAAAAWWAVAGSGTDEASQAEQATPAEAQPARAGLRAWVDPVTGELTERPPEGADLGPDRFGPGLPDPVVIPSQVDGGGVMLLNDGRYNQALVARVAEDGSVSVACEQGRGPAREGEAP